MSSTFASSFMGFRTKRIGDVPKGVDWANFAKLTRARVPCAFPIKVDGPASLSDEETAAFHAIFKDVKLPRPLTDDSFCTNSENYGSSWVVVFDEDCKDGLWIVDQNDQYDGIYAVTDGEYAWWIAQQFDLVAWFDKGELRLDSLK